MHSGTVIAPVFFLPDRDLTADDVTPRVKQALRRGVADLCSESRSRPVLKITGWPRLGFLNEVFPDAKFIHVVRDGRAVVNSMLNVDWWSGWRGPNNWRWGALTPQQEAQYLHYQRSFVALAGIEWNILMDAMAHARGVIAPDRLLEIRYEDFCADVAGTMTRTAEFCGLPLDAAATRRVQRYRVRDNNFKWQQELSASQQAMMCDIMSVQLQQYGYA